MVVVFVTATIERTELTHTYRGRAAAVELMKCRAGEVLMSGPVGTGKSRACLEKLNLAALKYPNFRGLIVRQVRDTLASTALETFEKHVIAEQLSAGAVIYKGASGRHPARYEYNNGSEIWLGGLDKPSKVMSSEYDMIYFQEATEGNIDGWEALTTRLGRSTVMPYQQLIADCNPNHATHWLNLRCHSGDTTKLESRHTDNPLLANDDGSWTEQGREYMSKLDKLTGVRKLRLRDGIWAAAEGVCWPSFDPAKHLIRPEQITIGEDWPRFWVVDFGMVHPFVLTCWAQDPDGRLYRYREMHMTGRLVEDHAKQIMGIVRPGAEWNDKARRWDGGEWIEPKPRRIICDHDAEDRATLERYLGMRTAKADKRVKLGIEAVESWFRDDRLFLVSKALVERDQVLVDNRKPTSTEEEIGGYVWDEDKEAPVKEDDDGCDTVRYIVAHFDLKPRLTSRDRRVWL